MIFCAIPKYILLNVIQGFCVIDDIGRLEIALGSTYGLKVLRGYFQSMSVALTGEICRPLPLQVVWWLSRRQLLLNEMNVIISLNNWKKMYDHDKSECYTSLSRLTSLCIDCSTAIQMDIRTWFTRMYQYIIGTSNKQILCNTLQQLIFSIGLTTLELVGLPYSVDDTLIVLAQRLHLLRVLRIEDCKKIATLTVESLVRNNTSLQSVVLRNNHTLWANVLIESVLTVHIPHSLQALDLTFTSYEAHHASVALTTLFQRCAPNLTSLSTNTWDALINAHQFPSLTTLCITYTVENYVLYYSVPYWHSPTYLLHVTIDVSATTDITAYYIVKSHPQLLSLCLVGSDFLTVVAVQDILKYSRQIQHLGLVQCSLLGSDSVYTIANRRPATLTSLDLRGLQGISTESVLHLLSMCVHLKEVDVRDCAKLDSAWLHDYCVDNRQLSCKVTY